MPQNRKMPSHGDIRKFWAERLVELGKFDSVSEVMEGDCCFACGFEYPMKTEKSHIKARCEGGSDAVENINLLCRRCHFDSELLSVDEYWKWLSQRSIWHVAYEAAIASGRISIEEIMHGKDTQRGI